MPHNRWYLEYEEREGAWCTSRLHYHEWFSKPFYNNMKRIRKDGTTLHYRLHVDKRLVFDNIIHKVI